MKCFNNILNSKKGFILLYAVLIMSMLLALTFSITDLTIKERQLSRFSEESFSAFFAAESGMECVLYWDMKDEESWFRYDDEEPGGRNITCNGQTFTVGDDIGKVTELQLDFSGSSNSSVIVVDKSVENNTSLMAYGYSVADPTSGDGIERGLRVSYGDEVDESDEDCDAFDLIFVLDNSGSIDGPECGLLKDAAKKVVNNDDNILAEDKFKMSVVSFDWGANLEVGLTTTKNNLLTAIDSLTFPGMTNMEGGLFVAQKEFLANDRDDAHDIIVIITDGITNYCIAEKDKYDHDTDPKIHRNNDGDCAYSFDCADTVAVDNAEAVAAELHEDVAIVVVGVGITNQSYVNFLKHDIADRPDNYEKVEKFEDLDKLLEKFDCSYFMRAIGKIEREEF